MESRRTKIALWILIAVVALSALAAGMYYLFKGEGEAPVVLTSPWPGADSERTVTQPEAPVTWPLTGLSAPDAVTPASVRILSVKVENSPAARPQSGLQGADVVYESITEGGITRFNCLFHSQVPVTVGPVRSARLSDIDIVPQYDALFAFSGASGAVNAAVRAAGLQNLSQDAGVSAGYRRSKDRKAPHNLFLDLGTIRAEAVRKGYPVTQSARSLAFDRTPAVPGSFVSRITIPFSTANTVVWSYDAVSDLYLRTNNGAVHSDALTGTQIGSRNVVVIWARMTAVTKRDVSGSRTFDIELVGSGRASVFRNGQRYDGTWEAPKDAPPVFKAADGTIIRLAPGNTWMQVVPTNVNIIIG